MKTILEAFEVFGECLSPDAPFPAQDFMRVMELPSCFLLRDIITDNYSNYKNRIIFRLLLSYLEYTMGLRYSLNTSQMQDSSQ